MARFPAPWTICDDNEFGIPLLPVYVTVRELGLIFLAIVATYGLTFAFFGDLLTLVAVLGVGVAAALGISKYKATRPASWLWDLLLGLGTMPTRKGLVQPRRGVMWLSKHHLPGPAPFLSGSRKPGQDLSASTPIATLLPPGTLIQPVLRPRVRRVLQRRAGPIPAWWQEAALAGLAPTSLPLSQVREIAAGEKA
jgi:hypothetical protein